MTDFDQFEDREILSEADAKTLQEQGVLAMDPERALPLWFDGRYLTARDLNREQNYFLSRQTAIGKAIGRGVIEGLDVRIDSGVLTEGSRLVISAGQGVAFDGAHIILPRDLDVNLADLAVQDAINAQLGLSMNPGASIRSRTGIFVLSLRAVEYTANQTASFPTHVTGERTTHMGDRIEAVAVTLTPYAPIDAPFDSAEARAMATQRIFQGQDAMGTPGHALPLAMLALRNGSVEWLDPYLARRDLVASRRDFLGMGLSQDQLRLSHFNQYQTALSDVVNFYIERGQPARFNAEQHFRVLPAAGPLPAACVDPGAQTQIFFPGEVEVELSIVPEDELPSLIDDSFELPPIDLTRPPSERDSLSVMVIAPLPRTVLRSQLKHLGALQRPLKPISLLGQGPQKPIDKLGTMRIALADVAASLENEDATTPDAWASVIRGLSSFGTGGDGAAPMLWYIRRRTLRENADLESALAPIDHLDLEPDPEEPPVDPGDPDPGPDPDPRPDPRPELSEEERRALIQLAGFGDLAKIARAQFERVNDSVSGVYIEGLGVPQIRDFPLSVTALTARIAELRANDTAGAKKAVESLSKADVIGMRLLGAGLLGEGTISVTAARFKELQFFVTTEDLLEQTTIAIRRVRGDQGKELVLKLREAVGSGSDEAVKEVVNAVIEAAQQASRPRQPDPTPTPQPGQSEAERQAEARRRAEEARRKAQQAAKQREAQARARADALVKQIKDKGQQKTLQTILQRANPTARDALVSTLDRANVEKSRIATGNVLARIGSGTKMQTAHLSRVNHVTPEFVSGLAALEPLLLAAPKAPAKKPPTRKPGNKPGRTGATRKRTQKNKRAAAQALAATRRGSAQIVGQPRMMMQPQVMIQPQLNPELLKVIAATTANTVNKRLQLLSTNGALKTLAAFGHKHRSKKANLKKVADQVIRALDAKNANPSSVMNAIVRATRSVR